MKFSERETYQFVKAYFSQEGLWNTKHLAYKSNERRLIAYKAVIEEFKKSTGIQLTLTELRVKIKNLKSTYSQELDKIRRRSSAEHTYKPAMKWFAVWDKYIQAKKVAASLDESNTTDEENQKTWLPVEDDNSVDPFESNQSNDFVMLIKPEPKSKQDEKNAYKRTRNTLEHSTSTEMSDVTTEYLNTGNLMKDDEFDIYGKYIASQLRSMDIERALTLQIEIQSLVSGARLADLNERNSS
ncbi:uncharacterized protein LOC123873744 [Maniola jurtina]|uniref:uncharacterized protein LOC123873744 n=1 Tax=Maniola jurtina TaxID=191418 RepID=UPI001E68BA63|nr:uncharacterized protein LOC123873744 [Maniola jurtina]